MQISTPTQPPSSPYVKLLVTLLYQLLSLSPSTPPTPLLPSASLLMPQLMRVGKASMKLGFQRQYQPQTQSKHS